MLGHAEQVLVSLMKCKESGQAIHFPLMSTKGVSFGHTQASRSSSKMYVSGQQTKVADDC